MSDETIIKLSKAYEAHGQSFTSVTLRAPTFADFAKIGHIEEWQPTPSGPVLVRHHDRVQTYLDRLLAAPEPGSLASLNLADTLALNRAVAGFFRDAETSKTPPTS